MIIIIRSPPDLRRRVPYLRILKPVEVVARLKPLPPKQHSVARTAEPTPPPVREGDLVALGPDVTPPRKVSGKSAYYPSGALAKRPVAWRVKDYADGWIIFQDEETADYEAQRTGAVMQGLYVRDGTLP